jgi:protein-L-isoaspartate(D-aspartate) O-methyltransferase
VSTHHDCWRTRATCLAQTLVTEGVLRDRFWRRALEETPTHVFVPRFYIQQPGGTWLTIDANNTDWLDTIYPTSLWSPR